MGRLSVVAKRLKGGPESRGFVPKTGGRVARRSGCRRATIKMERISRRKDDAAIVCPDVVYESVISDSVGLVLS